MSAGRGGQRGLGAAAWTLLAVVAVIVGLVGLVTWRVFSAPDLGAAPRGPSSGNDARAIAVTVAERVAPQFLRGGHGTAILSEQDLTTIVRQNDTAPDLLTDPEARVRGGQVLVDGGSSLGPLSFTATGYLGVTLTMDSGGPRVSATVEQINAGTLPLPGFLRDQIDQRVRASFDLTNLLDAAPQGLGGPLRSLLECLRVGDDGIHLGFHRPLTDPDPHSC